MVLEAERVRLYLNTPATPVLEVLLRAEKGQFGVLGVSEGGVAGAAKRIQVEESREGGDRGVAPPLNAMSHRSG